jgi:hypothetical protein
MERTGEHLPGSYGSKTSDLYADVNGQLLSDPLLSDPLLSGPLPSGPLRLLRVVDLPAPAVALFGYITDHDRICDFVPGMLAVNVDNGSAVVSGGQGCVRYCDFGNDMIVAETIVLWNPPEAFGFRIASPNPFGLYDHLALITIEEVGGQSRLTWLQYYDHADLPTMNAFMAQMLDGVVGHLTGRFGGRVVKPEEGGRENVSLASRVGVKSE